MEKVSYEVLFAEFRRVLDKHGFPLERSQFCARIFADNTRDGINSHGINRFPGFIDYVQRGLIDPSVDPLLEDAYGAFERWNGATGAGIVNAVHCMERAIALAHEFGIGCTALRNTNHWMRAGTYGLQAADAGCIGICWTNTQVLMPPWGGKTPKLGNNPLVLCMPRPEGHLLLDMAMSQFSLGRMMISAKAGDPLPVPGGFDEAGELTRDPAAIVHTKRSLPIGYWKGSGLSLLLDCIVSALSGGRASFQIGSGPDETDVSQVFMAIDLAKTSAGNAGTVVEAILADVRSAEPVSPGRSVTVPGEQTAKRRQTSQEIGIPVDPEILMRVRSL
ncbi:3-dehydro-L-gulonate 2-dehydrogenase [Denitromonas sp.]|uniref:3-dehydro-L-gulonate 2-dehydrogenase n=1 Tax=Denitromonas sp. TaxID=2734609 RepID=UPI002AFDF567|nr:3-dehydro-L-gulonate 2-dehydrogenase [Denitromonas sp.]